MISVDSHGPLIVSTNYWESDLAHAGKLYVSVNAGAIRVLLPASLNHYLAEMQTGKHCVLSRGPWPAANAQEAVELMWDDHSDSPFALHLTPASFDMLPASPDPGREWICAVWTSKHGKPHKSLERICHWRRVDSLPYLKPWQAK